MNDDIRELFLAAVACASPFTPGDLWNLPGMAHVLADRWRMAGEILGGAPGLHLSDELDQDTLWLYALALITKHVEMFQSMNVLAVIRYGCAP